MIYRPNPGICYITFITQTRLRVKSVDFKPYDDDREFKMIFNEHEQILAVKASNGNVYFEGFGRTDYSKILPDITNQFHVALIESD